MKLAIVGISGLVGNTILKVLEEQDFQIDKLIPVASKKSIGNKIMYQKKKYTIISIEEAIAQKPDIAIFSAGSLVSLKFAPKFAEIGCFVIDNSSAWRMDKSKKLIVPEINGDKITRNDKIIANPNCSTIQMVLPLSKLHQKYKIKRIVVSTYQSISGSGQKAIQQFENERNNKIGTKIYPYQIDKNCLPHCDDFTENDYTKEEMKLVNETHKIFNDNSIGISATAVRVPVTGGHSESINVEFETSFLIDDIRKILSETKNIILQDDIKNNIYPMPITAEGKDAVFVGRLRNDLSQKNTLNMWVVADNLRKGAATNTVQIAQLLIDQDLLT